MIHFIRMITKLFWKPTNSSGEPKVTSHRIQFSGGRIDVTIKGKFNPQNIDSSVWYNPETGELIDGRSK